MGTLDELHSKETWIKAVEGMTFFGTPVSEMKEDDLRLLVGFLVTKERIMGFPLSRWDGNRSARWIRASERLPEMGQLVLLWFERGSGSYDIGLLGSDGWRWPNGGLYQIPPTIWMPLPQPPEVKR